MANTYTHKIGATLGTKNFIDDNGTPEFFYTISQQAT